MTPEQLQLRNAKPLFRMRRFAQLLNWRGLQLEWTCLSAEVLAQYPKWPRSGIVFWYITTDEKFNLQINELPEGGEHTHQATVKAERYRICNTGWNPFTLFNDDESLAREADRLRPLCDRDLFKNRAWARQFRMEHPEFAIPEDWHWKRRHKRRWASDW
jgi:hypothetical protein